MCPANLVEIKGHRFLIEAWRILRDRGFDGELWLAGDGELKPSLQRVLEKLERDQNLVRGAVMLLNEDTRDIHIESALGFGAEGQTARYKLGEGITGRVVESGRPIVVPAVSREPLFLNRAFQRKRPGMPETTFVCVPIVLDRKPVGALAVDLDYDQSRDYDGAQKFFAVVAGMIAQALRVERTIEDERTTYELLANVLLAEECRKYRVQPRAMSPGCRRTSSSGRSSRCVCVAALIFAMTAVSAFFDG